jgi:hypothetical protein
MDVQMIELGKTIISQDILEKHFSCNLSACKGACCVEGDAGAPLEEEELQILEQIYPRVKHFLREEGVKAIEEQGTSVKDWDGEMVTPLVNGKECAYVIFDENGITKCGIEKAHEAGEVDFKKPLSCHLYPVRVTKYSRFDALNYHKWEICSPACTLGKELELPVYEFVKDALIRKYGEEWYAELEQIHSALHKKA